MILHPPSSFSPETTRVPGWLRNAVSNPDALAGRDVEEIAFAAGCAITALDTVVRRDDAWAGAWRQRLALAAAAVTARQAGRIEEQAALRDAMLLTRPGDDVGPGGRFLLAWSGFAATPVEKLLTRTGIDAALDKLGVPHDEAGINALTDDLSHLAAGYGIAGLPVEAFEAADRHGFARVVGAWAADALLARRLGWTQAVPLLGTQAASGVAAGRHRRNATADPLSGPKRLLFAQAQAAISAIDLFAELGRRAERLSAAAPKLRAKGADAVIRRLLNEDALVASRGQHQDGMSDRGLRRLFDRLVELGAVRELSGRAAFRIYGL